MVILFPTAKAILLLFIALALSLGLPCSNRLPWLLGLIDYLPLCFKKSAGSAVKFVPVAKKVKSRVICSPVCL